MLIYENTISCGDHDKITITDESVGFQPICALTASLLNLFYR
jgi:hypothetical protein